MVASASPIMEPARSKAPRASASPLRASATASRMVISGSCLAVRMA